MTIDASPRFRIGPRLRDGLVPGLRNGQSLLVALCALIAVVALRAAHGPMGALVCIVALGIGAALAWLPIGGRNLDEWTGDAARFAARRVSAATLQRPTPERLAAVGPFRALHLEGALASDGARFGVVYDDKLKTASAVLRLGADALSLLSDDDQRRRVELWSSLLAGVSHAPGAVLRLQWIVCTRRDPAEELRIQLDHLDLSSSLIARQSYTELVTQEQPTAIRHDVALVVTVGALGSRRARARGTEPKSREEDVAARLSREVLRVAGRCRDAGLSIEGVLTERGLSALIRSSIDDHGIDLPGTWPWPTSSEERWDSVRLEGSWHATYWVCEWPRLDVEAGFLSPLLLSRKAGQTLSIVMAPIALERAAKSTEHARTSAMSANELRRRHGFLQSARVQEQQHGIARREHELAEGHGAFRFSGYLTISGRSRRELEERCSAAERAAAISHLDLRRLYGAQADSFCWSLPLGRGRS